MFVPLGVLFAACRLRPPPIPPAKAAAAGRRPPTKRTAATNIASSSRSRRPPKTTGSPCQYEIEVGRFDLAAGLLHSLLAKPQPDNMPPKKPTEEELLALEDKYGMAAFLALRNVEWSEDPKMRNRRRRTRTS